LLGQIRLYAAIARFRRAPNIGLGKQRHHILEHDGFELRCLPIIQTIHVTDGCLLKTPLDRRVNRCTFFLYDGLHPIIHFIQPPFYRNCKKGCNLFGQHLVERAQIIGFGTHDFKCPQNIALEIERRYQHGANTHVGDMLFRRRRVFDVSHIGNAQQGPLLDSPEPHRPLNVGQGQMSGIGENAVDMGL